MSAGPHVVFGTGPAGRAVAAALVEQGTRVRVINRSGSAATDGVETVGGDATDLDFARSVTIDATAVRHAFGGHTTSWSDIVTTTVDWYRAQATTPQATTRQSSHRLVEATTFKETS